MSRGTWHLIGFAVALALALVLPLIMYPVLALDILAWALFAVAIDLLLGFLGLLSFGQAMFWGTAGYVAGLTAKAVNLGWPFAVLVGTLAALLLAVPIGYLAIRRKGIYFAMVTLAFAQMIFYVVNEWRSVTGGENGLQQIPRTLAGQHISDATTFYYMALPLIVIGVFIAYRAIHSPFGHVLTAVRDNEARAQALGYPTNRYKLLAFVIAGGLSGLAGAIYTFNHGFASLDLVHWTTSGSPVLMTILGGIGTFWGPMIGAVLVVLLRDRLSTAGLPPDLITGIVFIIVVLSFRKGIWGTIAAYVGERRIGQRAPEPSAAAQTESEGSKAAATR